MLSTLFTNLYDHIKNKEVCFTEELLIENSIENLKDYENYLEVNNFQELLNFNNNADFASKPKCKKGYPCKNTCISVDKDCDNPIEGQAKTYVDFIKQQKERKLNNIANKRLRLDAEKLAEEKLNEYKDNPNYRRIAIGDKSVGEWLDELGEEKGTKKIKELLTDRVLRRKGQELLAKIQKDIEDKEKSKEEKRLDKLFSYKAIMSRGSKLLETLDSEMNQATSPLEIMENFRNSLIRSGMSRRQARELISSKEVATDLFYYEKQYIKTSGTDFYRMTNGLGSTTLQKFIKDNDRAYANERLKSINVGSHLTKENLWHEMGHHIEFENPRIQKAAEEWRDKRATSQEMVHLSKLTGEIGYGLFEFAKPDHYIHPYVGKVYLISGNTEVVSMGIQHFADNESMLDLYKKDKDMFKFILGVIKHD